MKVACVKVAERRKAVGGSMSLRAIYHLPKHFHTRGFNNGHGKMRTIINQARYVALWHLRQLLLKDAFQAGHNNGALPAAIVVDHRTQSRRFTLQ